MRQNAAKIRPTLRVLFASLIILSIFSRSSPAPDNNTPERHAETAKDQFDLAEKDRQTLESLREYARTLKQYESLANSYKRVYLITPHAAEVPAALNEEAELYRSMGDLFDVKYYQSAVDAYQFLLSEYPTTHFREEAVLAIARIQEEDLHDAAQAQKTYEQFLQLHPHSEHAAEVRAALEKLNGENAPASPLPQPVKAKLSPDRETPKSTSGDKTPPTTDTRPGAAEELHPANSSVPQVSRVRTWNADTYTRIVIDVGSQVKYQAARISGPDRIYFDIEGAKVDPALLHKPIALEDGGYLKAVRIAQNQSGVVRVVLEVNRAKDYSVFLLPDPYRLVVDLYGTSDAAERAALATAPAPGPTTDVAPVKPEKLAKEVTAASASTVPEKKSAKPTAALSAKADASGNQSEPSPATTSAQPATTAKNSTKNSVKSAAKADSSASPKSAKARSDNENGPDTDSPPSAAVNTNSGDASPPALLSANVKKSGKAMKSPHDQALEMGPPATPEFDCGRRSTFPDARPGAENWTHRDHRRRAWCKPRYGHDRTWTGLAMDSDSCLDVSAAARQIDRRKIAPARK